MPCVAQVTGDIEVRVQDPSGAPVPAANVDDDWFAPDPAGAGAVQMIDTRVACDSSVCADLLAGSPGAPMRVTFELTATPLTPLRAVTVVR